MFSDSIIKEVWNAKDAIVASCDYSPEKLAEMLKTSSFSKGFKTVDYHRRRKESPYDPLDRQATSCVAEEPAEYKTKED